MTALWLVSGSRASLGESTAIALDAGPAERRRVALEGVRLGSHVCGAVHHQHHSFTTGDVLGRLATALVRENRLVLTIWMVLLVVRDLDMA